MKFDLVIPTYKRRSKLIRCLDSINHPNINIYFDNNDINTLDSLPHSYFKTKYYKTYLMDKQYRAFGIWNHFLKHGFENDGMIYLCDDVELYSDALQNLFKEFETRFPDTDGVVTFNQANLPTGSDSAMGLIGRKFAERYPNNQCFCPDYVSFYADSEIGDYAKKLGKFYHCKEAKLTHYHPAFYKNEVDEAHRMVRDSKSALDKKVNAERKKRGLLWGENLTLIREEIKL